MKTLNDQEQIDFYNQFIPFKCIICKKEIDSKNDATIIDKDKSFHLTCFIKLLEENL